jgi:AcrR family transcriptional regulator
MITRPVPGTESTADVILDAADSLIRHYGYSKTTVDDIAHEAGIGKGTIYLHFHSKEDVAMSSIARVNDRLHERIRVVARGKGTPTERVREILTTRVLFRFDSAVGYTKPFDDMHAALRPRLMELRRKNHEVEAQILAEVLVEGRLHGDFSVDEALPIARTLIIATNDLLPYKRDPKELRDRKAAEATINQLVDLLLHGLLARGPCCGGDPDGTERNAGSFI